MFKMQKHKPEGRIQLDKIPNTLLESILKRGLNQAMKSHEYSDLAA